MCTLFFTKVNQKCILKVQVGDDDLNESDKALLIFTAPYGDCSGNLMKVQSLMQLSL
jgi:hypothetical protein